MMAKRENAAIWRRTATELGRPRRQRPVMNLARLNRLTNENDVVLVPGKVLGNGSLDHTITIAAESFSYEARKKVLESGGTCLSIAELLESKPQGQGIRLMK